jgi:hypothetical protein
MNARLLTRLERLEARLVTQQVPTLLLRLASGTPRRVRGRTAHRGHQARTDQAAPHRMVLVGGAAGTRTILLMGRACLPAVEAWWHEICHPSRRVRATLRPVGPGRHLVTTSRSGVRHRAGLCRFGAANLTETRIVRLQNNDASACCWQVPACLRRLFFGLVIPPVESQLRASAYCFAYG